MLRVIPDSANILAIDGVIPARAQGIATRADAMEKFARSRAAEHLSEAHARAAEFKRQAAEDGFSAGFAAGLQAAVAPLMSLLEAQNHLRDAALGAVREALEKMLADLDIEAELISRWCVLACEKSVEKPQLTLPSARSVLIDNLSRRPDLQGVDIRAASISLPVLEIGHIVLQFDPLRPLLKTAVELLQSAEVEGVLRDASVRYARTVAGGGCVNARPSE